METVKRRRRTCIYNSIAHDKNLRYDSLLHGYPLVPNVVHAIYPFIAELKKHWEKKSTDDVWLIRGIDEERKHLWDWVGAS
jgi:hypothetical protein